MAVEYLDGVMVEVLTARVKEGSRRRQRIVGRFKPLHYPYGAVNSASLDVASLKGKSRVVYKGQVRYEDGPYLVEVKVRITSYPSPANKYVGSFESVEDPSYRKKTSF